MKFFTVLSGVMIACVLTFFPMSVIAGAGLCQGVPFGACDTQNTNTLQSFS